MLIEVNETFLFLCASVSIIIGLFVFFVTNQHYFNKSKNLFDNNISNSDNKCDKPFEPVLISIEGNIGAGKSTLLENLRIKHPEWIFIDEPVHLWSNFQNEKNESILEVYYRNRSRWAYTFQNCALMTRYEMIEDTIRNTKEKRLSGKQIFITERCLDSDYHVFTKMLRADGSIDSLEFLLYERLLHQLQKIAHPLNGLVFVDTVPDVCTLRIKQRGRTGEDAIPIEYLQNLHQFQSTWVNNSNIPHIRTSKFGTIEMIENFILNFQK